MPSYEAKGQNRVQAIHPKTPLHCHPNDTVLEIGFVLPNLFASGSVTQYITALVIIIFIIITSLYDITFYAVNV